MAKKIDFHFDSTVMGMSMLSISPGIGSLGKNPSAAPDEIARAYFETILLGVGSVVVTRSYIPLITPFAYIAWNYMWTHSPIRNQINLASQNEEVYLYGDRGYLES